MAQAYYNSIDGVKRLTTETGAGQWGSALAFAGAHLASTSRCGRCGPVRLGSPTAASLIRTYGGTLHPSPSDLTESGRAMLAKDPNTTGSLGMAVSEAVEVARRTPTPPRAGLCAQSCCAAPECDRPGGRGAARAGGGRRRRRVGCAGGGSNLAGLSFPVPAGEAPWPRQREDRGRRTSACPSITEGEYRYDHGDVAGLTPLLKMHTLGMDFVPDPIHAGGLRYHGMAPALSHTVELGLVQGVAITQHDAFSAGVQFARTQGIVPAPESTHAIAACVRHVANSDKEEVVVIGLSGHGQLDLPAYAEFWTAKF